MAQPSLHSVHIDAPLTNISVAYLQAQTNFIAPRVFPVVPVDKQSDLYFTYTKNDWFRDEAKPRGAGTRVRVGRQRLRRQHGVVLVHPLRHP